MPPGDAEGDDIAYTTRCEGRVVSLIRQSTVIVSEM